MSDDIFDVLIIGGGPIGLACALAAKQAQLRYVVLEKGALVNSLYHYPANMTFFSTADKLEIGNIPFVSNNARPTRSEALEYYRRVAQSGQIDVRLFEKVEQVTPNADGSVYAVKSEKNLYHTKNLIVCTGFYDIPTHLGVVGEDLPKVRHYYDEPHFYYRQKVIVVGGNNSATDAALEIYRKGGDVTMVMRGADVGERVKYWSRPDIVNRIKEGSIRAFFESQILEIRPHEVVLQTPKGIKTIDNDWVLAMTGYQPNFDFLRALGIEFDTTDRQHPLYNLETQQSTRRGIYLAGVVCGGMDTHVWFIENSRVHAEQIVAHILGEVSVK